MRFLKRLVLIGGLAAGIITLRRWRRQRLDEDAFDEALAGADE